LITTESLPEEDFKSMIETYWKETIDFPLPKIYVVNDVEETIGRVNLDEDDVLLISITTSENFRPRGNIHYYDRVIPGLQAVICTKESRQRVRNLSKMVRAIVWDRKHNFPNYQLIKPIGYKELVNSDLNIWRAEITFQIEAHCISIETLA
jgi:hypothetical protein